jgi:signal transduction histidine kinase
MSIKVKLVLSNLAMIIIPTILSMFLAVMIIGAYIDNSDWSKFEHGEISNEDVRKTINQYSTVFYIANNYPEKLTDKDYIEKMEKELNSGILGFAVRVEGEVTYTSDKFDDLDFEKLDKEIKKGLIVISDVHNKYDNINALRYRLDFKDGKTGDLFLLIDASPAKSFMEDFVGNFVKGIFNFVKGVFFILILTTTILTFIVYRGIIKPIRKLKYGAEQIKDGNLSFELKEKSNDEIGQTCRAFEEMRIRLKESIESQLKMDESRIEFMASISHDLKTPITSIKGYVEGIIDGVADTPVKLDKYSKTIYSKAVDMDKLIDDLTFYSNQTLNKITFNYSKVRIKSFFEDYFEEVQLDFESQNIKFLTDYKLEDNVALKLDVEKFKRVVVNIVSNSIKFMDKDEKILRITIEDINEKIRIGIHDNGIGVEKEKLANIFDRFYRTDSARTTSKGGSGLGLAIVKQIIDEHSGLVWAKSKLGEGLSIFIEFEKEKDDI